ncbi:MAG: DegT/DnrJ/EryC1/StrS family aminotransferase [Fervidobacterium sp.]|uniref:dTDP-4-amino-4,6-dideoxygalactose transaminase n=1 Tax=Fervidobacterium gondwanense DSM 13020 TaxID=1121883 RepID=A0A1M7THM4_FERGO|nr:DegT/DnrJ/EryC1/StrS family aminotransferase [Fervidobacterium gondwanense]UXF01790.1 hypothetical protein IB67_09795 [Fervidobacterium riparium]SHN70227.1 dTDP-4-amino-4,6-dideoxygalactose transaminase [Fervidobacterium gondwanense DSM 13020]
MRVRLSMPCIADKEELLNNFRKILDSGYFVQGEQVRIFEEKLKEYLGTKYCIAVSSGTAALHLALLALNIHEGDEVIVPSFTFPATVNVIELVKAKPVFVDVDLDTYNINVKQIESKITSKTKAIMPVHLFGNPAEMDVILEIAKKYELKVIEDAAGALGSLYKGRKCGTIGDIGCFSFHPRKVITTAEGGLVVTNDDEIARKIFALRNHGFFQVGNNREFLMPGLNYRMNEFEAALGIVQMEKLDEMVSQRIKIANEYMKRLEKIKGLSLQKTTDDCVNSYQAFVVMHNAFTNSEIIQKLSRYGIETTVGAFAVHELSYYKDIYRCSSEDFPNAKVLHDKAFAIPIYNDMVMEEIEYVVESLERMIFNEDRE